MQNTRLLARRISLSVASLALIAAAASASGGARLAAPVHYGLGDHTTGLVTADFNADGHVDVASANSLSQDVTVLLETAAIISKRTDGKCGRVRALCSKACNAHADEVAGRALTAQSACLEHEFTSSTVSPHRRMGLLKDSVRFVSSAAWCLHRGGCV